MVKKLAIPATLAVTVLGLSACYEDEQPCHDSCEPKVVTPPADGGVTATDIAPTALGRARARAGALPILFALDDVTVTCLAGSFDVAVDCGLVHCLPPVVRPAYASAIASLVAPGGALLLVAHVPSAAVASHPLTASDVTSLLPDFALVREHTTTLARAEARLFELARLAL